MWQALPSVGDKNIQILLLQGVVLSQSTFHLVSNLTLAIYTSYVQTNNIKAILDRPKSSHMCQERWHKWINTSSFMCSVVGEEDGLSHWLGSVPRVLLCVLTLLIRWQEQHLATYPKI